MGGADADCPSIAWEYRGGASGSLAGPPVACRRFGFGPVGLVFPILPADTPIARHKRMSKIADATIPPMIAPRLE